MNIRPWLIGVLITLTPLHAQAIGIGVSQSSDSPFFWGGGIGASFGQVDTVSISPMLGMHVTSQLSTGISLTYTYRRDERFAKTLSTNDYGTVLFARYQLTPQFFAEANYEMLSNEYYLSNGETDRRDFNSLLAGGGIRTSLGGNASAYVSALYNFSYDDDESPYDDPWVMRAGVGFGF